MSKHKVLLICYYFPPSGGAGVGRPLALYKHLPEFGWDCHILTVKPVTYRVYEPELLDNLPREYIYRAGSLDPQRLMYLLGARKVTATTIERGRSISDRFFPDPKIGWVRLAIRLGRTLITNHAYDAVISTSPPISSHLVARQLSREFTLPWVADFRDYWTVYPLEKTYTDRRRIKRGQQLLADIKKKATVVTAINSSIGEYAGSQEIIYNSYDRDLARQWQLPKDKEHFIIGVLGALNDIYPIEPLLKVLTALREQEPALFDSVRVLQVGMVDINWLKQQLERYGLTDKFDIKKLRKRTDTIDLLSSTSLLFIGLPSSQAKGFSTGRIYTMLSSGRPILAAVPPGGEVDALIAESQNGLCFSEGQEDSAVAYLSRLLKQFKQGKSSIIPQPDYARKYASDTMAKHFAEILNRITS